MRDCLGTPGAVGLGSTTDVAKICAWPVSIRGPLLVMVKPACLSQVERLQTLQRTMVGSKRNH